MYGALNDSTELKTEELIADRECRHPPGQSTLSITSGRIMIRQLGRQRSRLRAMVPLITTPPFGGIPGDSS